MNLDRFNDRQKEAIVTTDGPLLILAGAGSGKTTVVVNKIAYILEQRKARPYEILAITFTNKAANELKERVEGILGDVAGDMWLGTFHSICMKILRRNIDKLGYSSDFLIYDSADQKTLIKRCLKELGMDEKTFPPREMLTEISNAKDNLMEPDVFLVAFQGDYRMTKIGELYKLYQKKLFEANALDFDDIIILTVKLFSLEPEVLSYYQNKFLYVFVDEYQDTNNAQYLLISLLAGKYKNICVVGDDDQSIYKFRGANINNILDFEKEFEGAKVIKLEQNYRSTQNILNAANSVIAHNTGRKGKELWTGNGDGEKILLFEADNEYEEADYIGKAIDKAVKNDGFTYANCAILYRTNAQSRVLETTLSGFGIPYRVLAGLRFYDRKEVKDMLAYLRLVFNPNDNLSLMRVVNEPARKIGVTTVEKVAVAAVEKETSMFSVMEQACEVPELSRAADKLKVFTDLIRGIQRDADETKPSKVLEMIFTRSGYQDMLLAENTVENQTRIENIQEFIKSAQEYECSSDDPTLFEFLESTALVADVDNYDAEADSVVLMTLHAAKGLEFPVVFMCGMEDGLFPSQRSMYSEEEIEEERRLCYVGITRAKQRLHITYAMRRSMYGGSVYSKASRFLDEIPPQYVETIETDRGGRTAVGGGSAKTQKDLFEEIFARKPMAPKAPAAETANYAFKEGDVVMHKKFGRGMILSVTPAGGDVKLEIVFDEAGTKSLMGSFARLTKA
ncbi:MAG: DNA helicase PcrA [Clostridia bacterium]|nr:DNA helicase PcrA [Clostridia bacterium]